MLARALAGERLAVTTSRLGSAAGQLDSEIVAADLVIGAVLEPGTLSPKLISRAALRSMRDGSAFVDVGIDQGGIADALEGDAGLAAGAMVWDGAISHDGLAADAGRHAVRAPWRRQRARSHESAVERIAGKP